MERYYLGNNSGSGFYGFFKNELAYADRVLLLKGGPGTGKSTYMKQIARECFERGYDREEWYCSGDPSSLDGIYIKELNRAVVDATAPHATDPDFPILKERIVNLGDALSRAKLMSAQPEIESAIKNKKLHFSSAYRHLKCALCNYENILECQSASDVEETIRHYAFNIHSQMFDFDKADFKCNRKRHLFNRVIAPDGEKEFYDFLRNNELVLVRGSTYARKIFFDTLTSLLQSGTFLHLPLNPADTEGIICCGKAVLADNGKLNESASEIIDLSVFQKNKYYEDCSFWQEGESASIKAAERELNKAKACHLEAEKYYIAAMDFDILNEIKNEALKGFL